MSAKTEIKEFIRHKQWKEAASLLQTMLRDSYNDAEVWHLEASYRMQTDDWESAEHAIGQAMQLAPTSPGTFLVQAQFEAAAGQYYEALLGLEQVDFDGLDADVLTEHALMYAKVCLAWFKEESEDQQHLVEEEDIAFYMTPELEDAMVEGVRRVKALLELASDNVEAHVFKAKLAEAQDRETEALLSWERANELAPNDQDILYGLARTLESLDYLDEAFEAYSSLHALEAESWEGDEPPLLFSRDAFEESAMSAWSTIQEEWSLAEQPFVFRFRTEVFPSSALMAEGSPEELFDPRVGLHVSFLDPFAEKPVIEMVMFQRNIERDMEGDELSSLSFAIGDLIESYIERVFSILEQDEEDEWSGDL